MLKRINCESAQSIFVGRKKNSDKIEFLVKKWKCREEVPEHYRGIIISSEKLKTKYDEPVIGKRAQSFPPKYTTFARINRVDVAEACQVMGHLTDPVVVVDPGQKKRQDVLAKTPYNEFTQ